RRCDPSHGSKKPCHWPVLLGSRHVRRRPAPSRKVVRLLALGQGARLLDPLVEILLDTLAGHPAAKEICPQKFAERRRLLGKAAHPAELAGEAAERIVEEIADRFRDGAETLALAVLVVRVHPAAMIEHHPECVAIERSEIRHDGDQHVLLTLVEQRAREVMMIDDVVVLLRPEDDRDHMLAETLALLLAFVLTPALALLLHLAHADRDLRGTQVLDRNRMKYGLAYGNHRCLRVRFRFSPISVRRHSSPRCGRA